jgi:hypothetical protein
MMVDDRRTVGHIMYLSACMYIHGDFVSCGVGANPVDAESGILPLMSYCPCRGDVRP